MPSSASRMRTSRRRRRRREARGGTRWRAGWQEDEEEEEEQQEEGVARPTAGDAGKCRRCGGARSRVHARTCARAHSPIRVTRRTTHPH